MATDSFAYMHPPGDFRSCVVALRHILDFFNLVFTGTALWYILARARSNINICRFPEIRIHIQILQ